MRSPSIIFWWVSDYCVHNFLRCCKIYFSNIMLIGPISKISRIDMKTLILYTFWCRYHTYYHIPKHVMSEIVLNVHKIHILDDLCHMMHDFWILKFHILFLLWSRQKKYNQSRISLHIKSLQILQCSCLQWKMRHVENVQILSIKLTLSDIYSI